MQKGDKEMKAIRIHSRGGPDHLVYEDAPQPHPGQGEVLVRVYAAGIIANELKWDETYQTTAGSPRALPIPGRDLSGVVEEVGPGVTTLVKGSEVYAMLGYGRDGAEADSTIDLPDELVPKPRTLDYVQAAAVPLSALTAWQALFDHAHIAVGQSVLIHGAAGGVGVFAVQLAHWAGAQVIATASARNRDFLHELGANEVIDYTTTRFEDVVHGVDLVFDLVGGDTLQRSWQVIKLGGTLVSVVSPRGTIDVNPIGERYMNTHSKEQMGTGEGSRPASAEQRLKELGIKLPAPPEPFGTYVEAVQTGNLLFLSGMLPTEGHGAKFIGRVGAELDVEAGRKAAHLAALNVLAVARQHLGSLDKVTRIVRLGVSVVTSGDVRDQPKVADAASELLQDVFGKDKSPCRLVYGVASLPLGTPVELEVIFEVIG